MKKNLYHYRVIFSITNLPHEDDYFEVKEFDCDYLHHSEAYAKAEFKRIFQVIYKGPLPSALRNSSYEQADFGVALYLIRQNGHNEQEYLLMSLEGLNHRNLAIEKSVLDRESVEVKTEYNNGLLRHSVPTYQKYFFRKKVIETKSFVTQQTEKQEIMLRSIDNFGYDTFDEALKDALSNQYWDNEKRYGYDPEDGDFLQIQLFLVKKDDDGEEERIIYDNYNEYPLEDALRIELSDKSFMEYYNLRRSKKEGLKFGIKPLLWTKQPLAEFQKEGAPQVDLTELTEDYYQDLPEHLRIWDSMDYYYLVFEGQNWKEPMKKRIFLHHNLQKIRQAAIDFFDNVILDHITGSNSSDNLPKVSLLFIRKDRSEPFYLKTTDPSKEQFLISGMREEKEILESLGYDDDDNFPHFQL